MSVDDNKSKAESDNGKSSKLPYVLELIQKLVDRFGFTGTIIIYLIYFIEIHTTDDQKHQLFDRYFLGQGLGDYWYVTVVFVVLSGLAFFTQRGYYKKIINGLKKELTRIGEKKSELQEKRIGKTLSHSKTVG